MTTMTEYEAKQLAQLQSEVKTGDFVACPLNDSEWIITRYYSTSSPYTQHVYNNGALRYSA